MAERHLDGLVNLPDFSPRYRNVWRARVTRVDAPGNRVWVEASHLTPGFEYGPCDTRGLGLGVNTGTADPDAHTHAVSSVLALGNSVLLAFVGGDPRDPVIIRRLQED